MVDIVPRRPIASDSLSVQIKRQVSYGGSWVSFRVQQPPKVLAPTDARTVLLARLVRTFPLLTEREREITARSILGESAAEIGAALAIKPATVHTYRLRAYARYGFSRSSDFLTALLD